MLSGKCKRKFPVAGEDWLSFRRKVDFSQSSLATGNFRLHFTDNIAATQACAYHKSLYLLSQLGYLIFSGTPFNVPDVNSCCQWELQFSCSGIAVWKVAISSGWEHWRRVDASVSLPWADGWQWSERHSQASALSPLWGRHTAAPPVYGSELISGFLF